MTSKRARLLIFFLHVATFSAMGIKSPNPVTVDVEGERFKIDTAKLIINTSKSLINETIEVLQKSDECYQCAYYPIGRIEQGKETLMIFVDTRWRTFLNVSLTTGNMCSVTFDYLFGEYGEYSISFNDISNDPGTHQCSVSPVKIEKSPYNNNIPILIAFVILVIIALFACITRWLYETKKNSANVENISDLPEDGRRKRLGSIDTFRGFCLLVMIFVNYGGGKYWFFGHATWNGLTVADLVFPWFMFIMGINIPLSINSLLRKSVPRKEVAYKVVRRTLILFALGLTAININTTWTGFRVPGVLQRFAVAYLFAFALQWAFHKSQVELHKSALTDGKQACWYCARDIFLYWQQWIIVFALETLWLLLTFLLPVPGCPTGYLGPGGLADDGQYMNSTCIGGAAGYIDRWMFGEAHIYGYPSVKAVYYPYTASNERVPFDPEGVLGSINGCIIVFLGSQMGKIFLYYERPRSRIVRWLCWGLLLGVISIILCRASANEGWIPVNKNLWTTTFVTTLSCFAFFFMIFIYSLIDVLKWWSGFPFDIVGMNSIFIYVGHQTFSYYIPFSWGANEYSTHAEWLAMNMLGVFYWVVIAYYCCKIKFFVKI